MEITAPVKITKKVLKIAGIALAITGTLLVLSLRPPVLMVTDELFISLYGVERAKKTAYSASISLCRPVRPVLVSDEAAADVLTLAVEEASWRPYCVVFPYRYADSARRYADQNPKRKVILLAGRANAENFRPKKDDADGADEAKAKKKNRFFIYNVNGTTDFYRAGRIAGIFGNTTEGEIPVFFDRRGRTAEQEAFSQGMQAVPCESTARYLDSFGQLGTNMEFPVVILAGSGMEYLDRSPKSPIVLFTWLDPALTSRETRVIFDDSPWAQLVPALKLMWKKKDGEAIPSKILIFPERTADKGIIRGLKKAVRSSPEKPKPKEEQP